MIKAIVFDMDGTLINSIPLYLAIYERALCKELGLSDCKDTILKQFGKNSRDIMLGVLEEMNIDPVKVDIDAILAGIRKEFMEGIGEILLIPGAREALERLKPKYKIALATSSRIRYVGRILTNLGLEQYFDAVVTADEVMRAKPAPDIYLLAAKKLGVRPSECVAIEDAAPGVESAKGAGMKVIGVTTGSSSRADLASARADKVIGSLDLLTDDILSQIDKT